MQTAALREASQTPCRVLIVNPFGIGDVLFGTPLVRAVRQAFPESRVTYLCNRRTEGILRTNPHVDELIVYEKDELVRLWRASRLEGVRHLLGILRQVRLARFDLVVDLSLGERYGLILKLLGIRRRVGFNYRRRGRFLTESLIIDGYHDEHVVGYYRRLLRLMGIQLRDDALELHLTEADRRWAEGWLRAHGLDGGRPLIGMVPAGGVSWGIDAPFRRWSAEGFAAVGDQLIERYDATVLLFGERSDAPVCQTVAGLMAHPVMDLSGETSLGQFVALLARLHLVICNDGGPLHLAVSQGVRTVSIFGPVDPKVYGPHPRSARHQVVCREDLACRPCYHAFRLPPCPYDRACLASLEAGQVLEACDRALASTMTSHV